MAGQALEITVDQYVFLQRCAKIVLAKSSFWEYCRALAPEFYREEHAHLKELCEVLQLLYERQLINPHTGQPYTRLIIELPPRHGKTRTLIMFCQWVFGQDNNQRVICMSYNDETAVDFSKYTRNGITEVPNEITDLVYSNIFPDTTIARGDAAMKKWALTGQHFNYLGSGVFGSMTSKGGTIQIIDDLIKNNKEAMNEDHLRKINGIYASTFLSRTDAVGGGEPLEILCMTPWAKRDVIGVTKENDEILRDQPRGPEGADWYVFARPAYDKETDTMLCPEFLSKSRYMYLRNHPLTIPEVFRANYDLERVDLEGVLYKTLKTYNQVPKDEKGKVLFEAIRNYTDTADLGTDYLCSINYGIYEGRAYILDVIYTQDGMEITEPLTAKMLATRKVNFAKIESNNGGRGFARAIKRIIKEKHPDCRTRVQWFHQTENKRARILTSSAEVQENVLFPVDWRARWPQFYDHITGHLKEGKNQVDDGPDVLAGITENMRTGIKWSN